MFLAHCSTSSSSLACCAKAVYTPDGTCKGPVVSSVDPEFWKAWGMTKGSAVPDKEVLSPVLLAAWFACTILS